MIKEIKKCRFCNVNLTYKAGATSFDSGHSFCPECGLIYETIFEKV